jgi:hypothetical protein
MLFGIPLVESSKVKETLVFFSCFLLPYIVFINVLSSLLECANDFSNFLKEK